MSSGVVVAEPVVPRVAVAPPLRTIRIGLLGLGQVGQAVARLAPEARRLRHGALGVRVVGALVRDVRRPRRAPPIARLTSNPAAFLRGRYDVVVEALDAIEPARTLVARLLGRGVPVVTANKALVAAYGAELGALARARGAAFRYEASALAGVPFLGALAERPFLAEVHSFTAIVNGTSNFILSTVAAGNGSFGEALDRARLLGLTEPDPSRDLDGLDAADKLSLLASLFGWGAPPAGALEVYGIRTLGPDDLAAARQLNATIKPVIAAARRGEALDAWVGPALVPLGHPLASLGGTLSGIQLSGRFIPDLFFSGPGAGPDVTAATVLDDVVEAVSTSRAPARERRVPAPLLVSAPSSGWFVRARFPGLVPDSAAAARAFTSQGLQVRRVTEAINDRRWLLLGEASPDEVTRAVGCLQRTHRLECTVCRALAIAD